MWGHEATFLNKGLFSFAALSKAKRSFVSIKKSLTFIDLFSLKSKESYYKKERRII